MSSCKVQVSNLGKTTTTQLMRRITLVGIRSTLLFFLYPGICNKIGKAIFVLVKIENNTNRIYLLQEFNMQTLQKSIFMLSQ